MLTVRARGGPSLIGRCDVGEEQAQSATHLAPVYDLRRGDVFSPNQHLENTVIDVAPIRGLGPFFRARAKVVKFEVVANLEPRRLRA
jgi:hypothetical protein